MRSSVLRFLTAADLGIVGMEVKEEKRTPESMVFGEKLKNLLKEIMPDISMDTLDDNQTISFKHRGEEGQAVDLPINSESDGTLAYLGLLGPVVEILATGGVLCVDELSASLHPLLVGEIVRLFNRIESNPRGAQLIFNSHDTELLNGPLLRRDEIWFTEKDKTGATRLYPLSDFKPAKERISSEVICRDASDLQSLL
jgi:AAA15 family ATPase/GTPase